MSKKRSQTLAIEGKAASCTSGCQKAGGSGGWCPSCRARRNASNKRNYHERIARGQCPCCSNSAEVGIFCFSHWLKNVGTSHGLGNKRGIALLRALWQEQQGRCAVTGAVLHPGSTASLDHVVPKSRGGSNEKSNLRWVLLRINQCKWDMTHEEFVLMCRTVAREQDRRDAQKASTREPTRSN